MSFHPTIFIYPLDAPITISSELGIAFDNPKSDEEIDEIKALIEPSLEVDEFEDILDFEGNRKLKLSYLLEKLSEGFPTTELDRFKNTNSKEEIVDALTRCWCIVRSSTKAEHCYWFRGKKGLNDSEVEGWSDEIVHDLCFALSFLLDLDPDCVGRPILLQDFDPKEIVELIMLNAVYHDERSELLKHIRFSKLRSSFLEYAKLIDSRISSPAEDKLIYAGGMLRSLRGANDYRIEIMNLVSVLELFVAHNPNSQRFNIEDSIGKQFTTKISILARDLSPSLEEMAAELKHIYTVRSNIAHGNFMNLKKELMKYSKHNNIDYAMFDIVFRLYEIVRKVLFAYLRDNELVTFLKNG